MKAHRLDFCKTNMFSKKFNEFIESHSNESYFPTYKNIGNVFEKIDFSSDSRKNLFDVLKSQYDGIDLNKKVKENLLNIKDENTYTVTTGHQLNIFSGPLYIIYKIISAIKLSENLNERYADKKFIPVYWMASEDHDFDEIKSFFSKGKTYEWSIKPSGAVGEIDPSSIKKLSDMIPESIEIFENAYSTSKTLSEAVRKYMDALFSDFGLIVFDPSSKRLKGKIASLIKDDILDNAISTLEDKSEEKSEVFIRKINFFYMREGLRERIESVKDNYIVNGTDISFTKEEMEREISKYPERFSPNVIMRCLYQQLIMPNVVYVGGPTEVIYWLSFRKFFEKYSIDFPVIVPRDSVLILSKKSVKTLEKYGLGFEDIFLGKSHLEKKALGVIDESDKNFSLEISEIKTQLNTIASKFKSFDNSMPPHVMAHSKKIEKVLSQIERRFIKSQKEHNKILVKKIGELFYCCFPEGIPQERKDNLLSYYTSSIIGELYKILDPMDLKFKVVK